MHLVNKPDEVPPPPLDPLTKPFIPSHKKEGGISLPQGDRGTKNISLAKALLDSIVFWTDLDEYMGVSQYTLANHYNDL